MKADNENLHDLDETIPIQLRKIVEFVLDQKWGQIPPQRKKDILRYLADRQYVLEMTEGIVVVRKNEEQSNPGRIQVPSVKIPQSRIGHI